MLFVPLMRNERCGWFGGESFPRVPAGVKNGFTIRMLSSSSFEVLFFCVNNFVVCFHERAELWSPPLIEERRRVE
jgi:hypothetical protein